MENVSSRLLEKAAKAPALAAQLAAVRAGDWPLRFSHVVEPARPFLAAILARAARKRLWILCPTVRTQESFFENLTNWLGDAEFLPEAEFAAVENVLPDPELTAERLALLARLDQEKGASVIVATKASLDQPAPKKGAISKQMLSLRRGTETGMDNLLEKLVAAGYQRSSQVHTRGQFAVRGGIVDLFSWQDQLPLRIEFFGDEIESLREFDVDTQTSVGELPHAAILLGAPDEHAGRVRDYLRPNDLVMEIEPDQESSAQILVSEAWLEDGPENFDSAFQGCELGEFPVGDFMLAEARRGQFLDRLNKWKEENAQIVIYFQTEGEIERFRDIFGEAEALRDVTLLEGTLSHGFCFPAANLVVLAASELFGRFATHAARRLQRRDRFSRHRAQIDFSELAEGDYVVHVEHGVGRFVGLIRIPTAERTSPAQKVETISPTGERVETPEARAAAEKEVLALDFAEGARLYVPLEQAYLVSRYVGVGKKAPSLSSLADARWARAKRSAAASVFDYAGRMLALQAERETQIGHAFAPDTKWQIEFERSFPFRETPDQLKAIRETKADMEQARSMDRLICGDVGFGKTEVAIRAAFKAVMEGKQVAVLTPTTVLAQQHFDTFSQRMREYPVRLEMLSRFRSQGEQRKVLKLLREGGIDIVVGTHRLISGDVIFKDLGLVVIDEEQRFGVVHKEKFKELFKLVDVLTLSATPIPRTLYLSLVGVKDMSTIETPPLNRLPVETVICGYDERIIRDAINRELERQGQVFFLHNRVQSIQKMRDKIAELCPGARVDIGHGQMEADELEGVMQRFVSGQIDVLVCTTIIESGLDIPNANTIIIDRADRFGLADLYQLRGRVGRAEHKAYAYLLLPREMMTVGAARKRINAIKQYSSLGAGFRIAMRDLEIRGAGSILGTAQSGHIAAVGFDLYCQLLRQAVGQLKGEKSRLRLEVDVRFDFVATNEAEFVQAALTELIPAFIPVAFISDTMLRIQAYRHLAEVTSQEQLHRLKKEWRDRFGQLPPAVDNVLLMTEIKLAAAKANLSRVEVRDGKLMLTRRGDFILVGGKFPRLVASKIEQLAEVLRLIRTL